MEATLMKIRPTGMSNTTANGYRYAQEGVAGSHRAAAEDLSHYNQCSSHFSTAERETGMPISLIGAVASRESKIGRALPPSGYGYDGHGYGVMQVDDRHHVVDKSNGPHSLENIIQGAGILRDAFAAVKRKFPTWTEEQQLQGGVAAYNFGIKNVRTVDGIDRGTTGNDYSNDTIARAQYYVKNA